MSQAGMQGMRGNTGSPGPAATTNVNGPLLAELAELRETARELSEEVAELHFEVLHDHWWDNRVEGRPVRPDLMLLIEGINKSVNGWISELEGVRHILKGRRTKNE